MTSDALVDALEHFSVNAAERCRAHEAGSLSAGAAARAANARWARGAGAQAVEDVFAREVRTLKLDHDGGLAGEALGWVLQRAKEAERLWNVEPEAFSNAARDLSIAPARTLRPLLEARADTLAPEHGGRTALEALAHARDSPDHGGGTSAITKTWRRLSLAEAIGRADRVGANTMLALAAGAPWRAAIASQAINERAPWGEGADSAIAWIAARTLDARCAQSAAPSTRAVTKTLKTWPAPAAAPPLGCACAMAARNMKPGLAHWAAGAALESDPEWHPRSTRSACADIRFEASRMTLRISDHTLVLAHDALGRAAPTMRAQAIIEAVRPAFEEAGTAQIVQRLVAGSGPAARDGALVLDEASAEAQHLFTNAGRPSSVALRLIADTTEGAIALGGEDAQCNDGVGKAIACAAVLEMHPGDLTIALMRRAEHPHRAAQNAAAAVVKALERATRAARR